MSKVFLRFRLLAAVLFVTFIGGAVSPAVGQWTTNFTAPFKISAVRFLDAQNMPLRGVIGGDITGGNPGAISYTTDGGANWNTALVINFTGYVTDFAWGYGADSNTGFASIRGNGTGPGILFTSDYGVTWKQLSNAPHEVNGLYYNRVNKRLFAATQSEGAEVSADMGLTWTTISSLGSFAPPYTSPPDSNTTWNGIAFINDTYGIICSDGGGCPFNSALNPYKNWLRTTDGGATWLNQEYPSVSSLMAVSSWQPVGIPGTSSFLALSDCDGQMYRSDDNGYSWHTVTNWSNPSNGLAATGSMGGDACSLFASTQNAQSVFSSINDGVNWQPGVGGPQTPIRTRFYVSPSKVWAFVDKNLEWEDRPVDTFFHVYPSDSIYFAKAGCGNNDTVIRLVGCEACTNGLQFASTSVTGSSNFSVVNFNPHAFCGNDAITVRYSPTGVASDTGFIHLHFTEGTMTKDTVLKIIGPGVRPKPVFTKQLTSTKASCECVDTVFTFANPSCSQLNVTYSIDGSDDDKAAIQVNDGPKSFFPNSSDLYHIHLCSVKQGTYNLLVTFHITAGSLSYDSTMNITLLVNSTLSPGFRTLNWTLKDACPLHDTFVVIQNTLCDSIIVPAPDSGHGTDFTYSLPFGTFPRTLLPGEVLRLNVHPINTAVGTHSRTFTWHWKVGALTDDFSKTFTFTYTIQSQISLKVVSTPSKAEFGGVPSCDCDKVQTLHISNTSCRTLRITNITQSLPTDATLTIDPGGLQIGDTLAEGQSKDIVVHYCASKGTINNADNGSITILSTNGTSTPESVVLALHGIPAPAIDANIASTGVKMASMDFGTIKMGCDGPKDLMDSLANGPCSASVISKVTTTGSGFTVLSPKQGDNLASNVSVPVQVEFNPTTSGTVTGSVIFFVTDAGGSTGVYDTIDFTAAVQPSVRSYTIDAIPATAMRDCDQMNTTVTLANTGQCDTMHITAVTPSDAAHVTLQSLSQALPVVLAPGASEVITLHFDPSAAPAITAPGPLVGSVLIAAGPDTTISYSIPLTSCQSNTVVTFSVPDSNLTASVCQPSKIIICANINNSSETISFGLSGSTDFSQTLTSATLTSASPVCDTIYYSPNTNGTSAAALTISLDGVSTRVIPLTGTSSAPSTAQIGIRVKAGDPTTLPADGSTTQTLELYLKDAIVNAPMNSAHVVLAYKTNVLIPSGLPGTPSETNTALAFDVPIVQGSSIPAGTVIQTIMMKAAVSDQLSTQITVAPQTRFGDSLFNLCTFAALSAGDVVTDSVSLSCGQNILVDYFNGTPLVGEFSIVPNPVRRTDGSGATVRFSTVADGEVAAEILDLSGNRVAVLKDEISSHGEFALPIPTDKLSEGTYFVRVRLAGYSLVRKFVVEKN